ncbi:MAG: hypothetical protein ACQESP_08820 [Candidatus Muiribacteriota bacterium]
MKKISKYSSLKKFRKYSGFVLRLQKKNCLRNSMAKFVILSNMNIKSRIVIFVKKIKNKHYFHAEVEPGKYGTIIFFKKK